MDEEDFELEYAHGSPLWNKRRPRALSWLRSQPRALRRLVRRPPALLSRLMRNVAISFLVIVVLVPVLKPSYTTPPRHYLSLAARCKDLAPGCANLPKEKIFISVSLHGSGDLAKGPWGGRALQLIRLLGPTNVYLSIYENNGRELEIASLE